MESVLPGMNRGVVFATIDETSYALRQVLYDARLMTLTPEYLAVRAEITR